MRPPFQRLLLLASTGLAAATLACPGRADPPATGEAATPSPDADADGDEVVVTGSTLRNQENIAIHRRALGVVDAVTQDDTGDLADETAAKLEEALKRFQESFNVEEERGLVG